MAEWSADRWWTWQWEGKKADLETVKFLHTHKTGALIKASVASGAIVTGAPESQARSVLSYGKKIGLAFQISDDILDVEGDQRNHGKNGGGRSRKGKNHLSIGFGLR